jgi:nucleoside recognition membrane protein YjiH
VSPLLGAAVVVYAVVVAVLGSVDTVRPPIGAPTGRLLPATGLVLEVILVAQALVALIAVAGGRRPAEPAVWSCYLLVSVAVVPVAAVYAASGERRRGDRLVLVVAAIATIAITARLHATWQH